MGVDVVIAGGGAAGLAVTRALAESDPSLRITVVDQRRPGADERTWCFWDDGTNPVPEAVGASWERWEVRTDTGVATAGDPSHPYRMVRARDYRRAMARQLSTRPGVRIEHSTHVEALTPGRLRTRSGPIDAPVVLDARGPSPAEPLRPGRVRLQQRFIGQWVRTDHDVFDPDTVTLMDFTGTGTADGAIRFTYVLPVTSTLALVEVTAFLPSPTATPPGREQIAAYLRRRWHLGPGEWTVEGEEAGSIPMSDQRPPPGPVPTIGVRAGLTRPSSGYAFSRLQRHARQVAAALATGKPVPRFRDRLRTRALDAVFLRFLTEQPSAAPDVFLRLFGGLPGPTTVRFLCERSTVVDELRLVLALPKLPFLRAAWRTGYARARARRSEP